MPVLCEDPFDYWRGLEKVWNTDATIVNLEHDVGVTDDHIAALLNCDCEIASWPYLLHWISCGRAEGCLSVADLNGDWATWSAIGLVKIAARARTGPLRREPWQQLELAVDAAVTGPWHVHGPPVDHWHW